MGRDPSEPFVEYARDHEAHGCSSCVVGGIGAPPTRPGGFDSVSSCLALNVFPDAGLAIEEMLLVTVQGGTLSACVWDYERRMEYLRRFWDGVASTDPSAGELERTLPRRPDGSMALSARAWAVRGMKS